MVFIHENKNEPTKRRYEIETAEPHLRGKCQISLKLID